MNDCIRLFRDITSNGFVNKTGTNSAVVGWVARYFRGSIYKTESIEAALESAFSGREPANLFGISSGQQTKVAVTTTVGDHCYLIANNDRGGSGDYIHSEVSLAAA